MWRNSNVISLSNGYNIHNTDQMFNDLNQKARIWVVIYQMMTAW